MALPSRAISAVIPTRGDVSLAGIVDHLRSYDEIGEIIIAIGDTLFNRYLAAGRAKHDVIYTQDDDCLVDARQVIAAYQPGIIVNAMTREHAAQYHHRATLVGFGAIFDRDLIRCLDEWDQDALFLSECDRVFTALNRCQAIYPPIINLAHASAPNRLYKQSDHEMRRAAIERRILEKTGIRA